MALSVVYGIDLGTCYSCISRDDGAGSTMPVKLLFNAGREFVPSVVTYDRTTGQPKVGNVGKACLRTRPECTKAFVKREMDREFCATDISVAGTMRKVSPVEISACILKHLFDEANKVETGAGRPPATQAVITVPAKFDEKQRARTKLAAELAGIKVLGLLQEPTAAAIAYDIPAGKTALVFDLGGGTLDVSIVTNNRGNYVVLGTPAGDDHLGGMDWDERIIELAFQKAGRRPDRSNAKEWNLLMNKAEKIKQALSDYEIVVDDEVEDGNIIEDMEVEIARHEFETKSYDLLQRCWAVVDKAIANAQAQSPGLKIDFFLTVGGSSRMPMISQGLLRRYGATYGKGKTAQEWLRIHEPDTAIANGAAKYARMLVSGSIHSSPVVNRLGMLKDKATHSYGMTVYLDGTLSIKNLVKSSDPIVYQNVYAGLSLFEASNAVAISIYENDNTGEHASLDSDGAKKIFDQVFHLSSRKPQGTPLSVRILRDMDGLIKITAVCEGDRQTFEVNPPEFLIDPETRRNIERSLALMDASR